MTNYDTNISEMQTNLNQLFQYAKDNIDNELEEYCDMMYCLLNDPVRFEKFYN